MCYLQQDTLQIMSLKKEDIWNKTDIVQFLAQQGMTPVRTTHNSKFGTTLIYYSPFRDEKHPSFEVFPGEYPQKWIDRAEMDKTGTILTLVARLKNIPDIPSNLNKIILATAEAYQGNILDMPVRECKPKENVEEKPRIVITKVNSIWYNSLIDYLNSRCISLNVARLFCKQVHYNKLNAEGTPSRERVDIGFPNNYNDNNINKADPNGGWELRMESASKTMPDGSVYQYKSKICNAKEPSYILSNIPNRQINIFEGFFDMLSAAEQKMRMGKNVLDEDYIVLNSVALADRVISKLESMDLSQRSVKLFLDNDTAGSQATTKIISALQDKASEVKDCRYFLGEHKDLNEWHIAQTREALQQQNLFLTNGVFTPKQLLEEENKVHKIEEPKLQLIQKRKGMGI